MVPILIPIDIMEALKILVNVRSSCSVDNGNPYLFATTKSASGHADGWKSVRDTCIRAGVSYPERMTATKMRHRASTYYSLLDVPENERKAFYTHMGHSREINETVYQCPTSVVEITKVGRYLEDLDNGCLRKTSKQENVVAKWFPFSSIDIMEALKILVNVRSSCSVDNDNPSLWRLLAII